MTTEPDNKPDATLPVAPVSAVFEEQELDAEDSKLLTDMLAEANSRKWFIIKVTTQPGTHASRIGETYAPYGCSWRNSVDSCDSNGCGRVFLDCKDEATRKYIGEQMEDDDEHIKEYEFI